MSASRIVLARQPVFATDGSLYGYKLLSRSSDENAFIESNFDGATLNLIGAVQYAFGFDAITRGTRALLNVTPKVLLGGFAHSLPVDRTVLELPVSLSLDAPIREALRDHRLLGFHFSVPVREFEGRWRRMLDDVDVLGIDFLALDASQRQGVAETARQHRLTTLGLKLESEADLEEARQLGCTLFQGFHLGLPEMLARAGLSYARINELRLLQETLRRNLHIDEIEHVIESERTLAEQLLKRANSVEFGPREPVTEVRRALLVMGERRLREWCARVGLSALRHEHLPGDALTTLTRAKLSVALAPMFGLPINDPAVFLAGLFGRLDPLAPRALAAADNAMRAVSPTIESSPHAPIDERRVRLLALAGALASGVTATAERFANELGIPAASLQELVVEAERQARANLLENQDLH